jgi:transcriptional regulator with XRE-family HTH domain
MNRNLALQKFGKKVRELRRIKNYSQEDLAEKAGLHRTYVGGIERGERNVALQNILRLAEALGITASELLEGIE